MFRLVDNNVTKICVSTMKTRFISIVSNPTKVVGVVVAIVVVVVVAVVLLFLLMSILCSQ